MLLVQTSAGTVDIPYLQMLEQLRNGEAQIYPALRIFKIHRSDEAGKSKLALDFGYKHVIVRKSCKSKVKAISTRHVRWLAKCFDLTKRA